MLYIFYFGVTVLAVTCHAESLTEIKHDPICKTRNGYYQVPDSCDMYIECRDYQAAEMICHDGLYFNTKALFPEYPCSYPSDVSCDGRRNTQVAVKTAECSHQFGFFASSKTTAENCGYYRMCVGGKSVEMKCPVGLAFDFVTGQCRWPEEVPSCNAEVFLGFKCPTDAVVRNYKFEGNCYAFFSCDRGFARLLLCDAGLAFDARVGRCVDASLVNC